jgi:tripartite-type tricarboxylate transporter receptor subunit TctC
MFHKASVFRKLACVLLALGAASATQAARADEWPTRAIRIVSPYAAGGVGDTVFRLIASPIEAHLGQRFIIDNRSGAAGNIGTSEVVRAAPDGYTFVFAPTANFAVNQYLFKDLGFDPITQLEPIATVAEAPLIAIVSMNVPAKTLKEFGALAKADGSKYNFGSPGAGSPTHLAGASYSLGNGDSMQHIAYRGTPPLLQALLSNDVQIAFPTLSPVLEHLRAGKLKALAVMSKKRLPELPNIPTAAEAGYPDLLFSNWWVLAAPKGTDPKIIARLASEIHAALADPAIRARLQEVGHEPVDLGPKETTTFLKSEAARYKGLIERTGIKLE